MVTSSELRKALQHGKAHKDMKIVWGLRYAAKFIPAGLFLCFWFSGFIYVFLSMTGVITYPGLLIVMLILFLIFAPAFIILATKIFYLNYKFKLGQKKLIIRRGLFTIKTIYIPYERIQFIEVCQDIVERNWKLYTIKIETAGSYTNGAIEGLKNPEPIKEFLNKVAHPIIMESEAF